MQPVPDFLENWLKDFSAAVRQRDFTLGKTLFNDSVIAFGTVCFRMNSVAELAAHQWQVVWPKTVDFNFNYASARAVMVADLATVVTEWESIGLDVEQKPLPRRGRATIVLQKSAAGWQAVHTHFSINPHSPHDPVLRHA